MRLRKIYDRSLTDKPTSHYGSRAFSRRSGLVVLALVLLALMPSRSAHAQSSRTSTIIAGASPFQDSMWVFNQADYSIVQRMAPSLPGFTITGVNGIATDPTTGIHYCILKLSGVSGRVLATMDIHTGMCTQVGNLGANFSTLAFNANGTLFGVTGDGASPSETMFRIDKTTAATTLFRALGNGADGEVIMYCPDNNYFYHWSGNGTVVHERFDTSGVDAIQNIPITGTTSGETFGTLYMGNGNILVSTISSQFEMWDTAGVIGSTLASGLPDDIRGLVWESATTIIDPSGPTNICEGSSVDLNITGIASGIQWYVDGAPISGATSATLTVTAAGNYNAVYTDNNGFTDSPSVGITVIVRPTPTLSGTTSFPSICDNGTFNYTASSALSGTTFAWSRASISGISNPPASGTTSISESLDNNVTDPVAVAYTYTLTNTNGCENVQFVTVAVNPTPVLFPTPLVGSICDGGTFTHTQNSLTLGVTYSWSRAGVAGIAEAASSGTGNISEALTNTTTDPIAVTYIDTLDIGGCKNTQSISVVVNPTPVLTTPLAHTRCDNTVFHYVPASATAGTTYTWTRASVTGIANAAATGADSVDETLDNLTDNPIVVTYVITLSANGCFNSQNVMVTVNPTPMLNTPLTPAAMCDSTIFNYPAASNTTGVTFAWSRAAITEILNPAATGTGNPGERLRNSASYPVVVTYVYTLTIGACTNTQNVSVTVNPKPKLSNPTPNPICDSTLFTFNPVSTTLGATFAWSRPFVSGIGALPGSGTNNPNEILKNNTNNNVTVTYVYTVSANGCDNIVNVPLVVRPTPLLETLTDSACSGVPFVYSAVSKATPPTTFAWSRASVSGISNAAGSGTNGNINETLNNSTTGTINVAYVYTLTVGAGSATVCTNKQTLTVRVRPSAATPVMAITSPNELCKGTLYQNFGAADAPAAGTSYTWTASNATIHSVGNNGQYALVDFDQSGIATIRLTTNIASTGCIGVATYTVNVTTSTSTMPHVIFNSGKFVCLMNNVKFFQWGYDDAATLDSVVLKGEVSQSYFDKNPDFVNKKYWVMTSDGTCLKKSYYNAPSTPKPATEEMTEMSVFPNPANDVVNVEVTSPFAGSVRVELVNMMGQVLNTATSDNLKTSINIATLPAGMYMVDCYMEGVKIGTAKFVKN